MLLSILLCSSLVAHAQTVTVSGTTKDGKTNLPISYTSIGVKNKPIGTVADSLGNFSFAFPANAVGTLDTVVFGRMGYVALRLPITELLRSGSTITMYPTELTTLNQVDVVGEKGKLEQYGRLPASMYLTPRAYKNIPKTDAKGREQATILDIDEHIVLKEINFFLSMSNYTKVGYRINFYSVANGLPHTLISSKDIIYETQDTEHWKSLNLEKYNIHLIGHKKIAIGFQLIRTELAPGDTAKTSFLIASYPSPLKKSYFREKSEAQWTEVKSSYLYINIKANKFKAKRNKNTDNVLASERENESQTLANNDFNQLMLGNNPAAGKKVNVDSGVIYYESYGKGEPLILLHGNNESMASFREQVIALSEKFNVIAIDSRGQGNSEDRSRSPYTYELFAKDVITVMDKIGIKKANVLGWSDGGNTGLILSYTYPERIKKLAVFGANLFPGKDAIREDILQIFEKRKLDLLKTPTSLNELRLTNLVLEQPNIKLEALRKIKIPVLVMAGENDAIKNEHTQLISQKISQSKLHIFTNGDHFVPIKQPAQFNPIVIAFMLEK